MFAGRQSFAGIRRRAAVWLIAAWAVFSVSQTLAACCAPPGGLFNTPTEAAGALHPHPHDASAHDDCCDTPVQPCPMVLDEAPPPVPSPAALLAQDQAQHPVGLTAYASLRLPAFADSAGRARLPVAQAPPDPIYLRLQRFLI